MCGFLRIRGQLFTTEKKDQEKAESVAQQVYFS
jgi:hypothetical protein